MTDRKGRWWNVCATKCAYNFIYIYILLNISHGPYDIQYGLPTMDVVIKAVCKNASCASAPEGPPCTLVLPSRQWGLTRWWEPQGPCVLASGWCQDLGVSFHQTARAAPLPREQLVKHQGCSPRQPADHGCASSWLSPPCARPAHPVPSLAALAARHGMPSPFPRHPLCLSPRGPQPWHPVWVGTRSASL